VGTTSEINISDAIAKLYKLSDRSIRDVMAVTEVKIMKVLSELANSIDRHICEVSAFCENQISQPWRNLDNLLHSSIRKTSTACQVENTKMLIRLVVTEVEKCHIGDQLAVRKS
tara:strand:- start:687 stop:1028 length:342 start_codon:yes stop_codon:yes gene_type:complete